MALAYPYPCCFPLGLELSYSAFLNAMPTLSVPANERQRCVTSFYHRSIVVAVVINTVRAAISFEDVSAAAGLDYSKGAWLKYGGAAVGDLDGDGCPDMVLGHHGQMSPEVYMNQCNGSFALNSYYTFRDVHALTPVRTSVYEPRMHFILSPGGGRGNNPTGSDIMRLLDDNTVITVSERIGMTDFLQRGRGAAPLRLRKSATHDGYTDVLITSAPLDGGEILHAGFQFEAPGITRPQGLLGDFAMTEASYVTTVDAKSDSSIDLLTLHPLRMFELTGDLNLTNISDSVFPKWERGKVLEGVAAAAEADFDNDGYWDLYLARAATGDLSWRGRKDKQPDISDVLLKGSATGYENVTIAAGVPLDTESRGVTVGDFNNDGWTDILLSVYTGKDLFLMNNGNGTFTTVEADWTKIDNAAGDMATAVDYDRDGRLDVIVSEGDWFDKSRMGYYRVLRNTLSFGSDGDGSDGDGSDGTGVLGNYLLVRVGSANTLLATSLHATVYVKLADGMMLMRRVGTPGTSVSVSYIELLHFGVGGHQSIDVVRTVWSDGSEEELQDVPANSYIEVGVL